MFHQPFKTLCATFLIGLLAVGGLAFAPAPSEAQQDVTIRYSFFAPPWTFPGMQMQEWARELEKRIERETDGEISVTVDMHPGGELLSAPEIFEGTRAGISDAGLGFATYDPEAFPLLSVFALPLDMPNATVASQVLWDIIQEYDAETLRLDGFEVLTAFTTEPAYIQSDEPVHSLEDLQGKEMRTRGAAIPIAEALGIEGIGMPMPEVYEAGERGIIEGNITSREVLQDFRLAELFPYVVDYPTDVGVFVAVMEQSRFDALPDEVQTVIHELRREMTIWTGSYHDFVNVRGALEWGRIEHGLEVIELDEAEEARWDEALEPVVDAWIERQSDRGLPAEEIVERVEELRDHYSEIWTIDVEE